MSDTLPLKVMILLGSSTADAGVSVAVHVLPPSDDVKSESDPFSTVKSVVSRPVTASVKVIVTVAVSPIFKAVSSTEIAGAVGPCVSRVKFKVEMLLRFPATSVWRTWALCGPSPVSVKELPEPVVQLPPPLVLYSQVAPDSRPVTLTTPEFVILSPGVPLSVASATVGALATRSIVTSWLSVLAPMLPTVSTTRTW